MLLSLSSHACLSPHTHLGGSKVTEGRLSPQHLVQDGTTPLPVRELSLSLCPQGPEPAPRTESQGRDKHSKALRPNGFEPLSVYAVPKSFNKDLESTYYVPGTQRSLLNRGGVHEYRRSSGVEV